MALPPRNGPRQRTRVEKRSVSDPGSQMNPATAGVGAAAIGAVFTKFGAQFKAEDDAAEQLRIDAQDKELLAEASALVQSNPDVGRNFNLTGSGVELNRVISGLSTVGTSQFNGTMARAMAAGDLGSISQSLSMADASVSGSSHVESIIAKNTKGMTAVDTATYGNAIRKGMSKAVTERAGERMKVMTSKGTEAHMIALRQLILTNPSAENLRALTALGAAIPGFGAFDGLARSQKLTDIVLARAQGNADDNVRLAAMRLAEVTDENGNSLYVRMSGVERAKYAAEGEKGSKDILAAQYEQIKVRAEGLLARAKSGTASPAELNAALKEMYAAADRFGFRNAAEFLKIESELLNAHYKVIKGAAYVNVQSTNGEQQNWSKGDINEGQTLLYKSKNNIGLVKGLSLHGPGEFMEQLIKTSLTSGSVDVVQDMVRLVSVIQKMHTQKQSTVDASRMIPDVKVRGLFTMLARTDRTKWDMMLPEFRKRLLTGPPGKQALSSLVQSYGKQDFIGEIVKPNRLGNTSNFMIKLQKKLDPDTTAFGYDTRGLKFAENFTPEAKRLVLESAELIAQLNSGEALDEDNLVDAVIGTVSGELCLTVDGEGGADVGVCSGPRAVGQNGKRLDIPRLLAQDAIDFHTAYGDKVKLRPADSLGRQTFSYDGRDAVFSTEDGTPFPAGLAFLLKDTGFYVRETTDESTVIVTGSAPKEGEPRTRLIPGHPSAVMVYTEERNGEGLWRVMALPEKIKDEPTTDRDNLFSKFIAWLNTDDGKLGDIDPASAKAVFGEVKDLLGYMTKTTKEIQDEVDNLKKIPGADGGQVPLSKEAQAVIDTGDVSHAFYAKLLRANLRLAALNKVLEDRKKGMPQVTMDNWLTDPKVRAVFKKRMDALADQKLLEGSDDEKYQAVLELEKRGMDQVAAETQVDDRTVDWGADDDDSPALIDANQELLMDRVADGTYPPQVMKLPPLADTAATIKAADTLASRLNARVLSSDMSDVSSALQTSQTFVSRVTPLTPTQGGTSQQAIDNNPGDLVETQATTSPYVLSKLADPTYLPVSAKPTTPETSGSPEKFIKEQSPRPRDKPKRLKFPDVETGIRAKDTALKVAFGAISPGTLAFNALIRNNVFPTKYDQGGKRGLSNKGWRGVTYNGLALSTESIPLEDRRRLGTDNGIVTVNLDLNAAAYPNDKTFQPMVVVWHETTEAQRGPLLKVAQQFGKLYKKLTGVDPGEAIIKTNLENLVKNKKGILTPNGREHTAHMELMNIRDNTQVKLEDGTTMNIVDYFHKHPKGMAEYAKLFRDNLSDPGTYLVQVPHQGKPGAARTRNDQVNNERSLAQGLVRFMQNQELPQSGENSPTLQQAIRTYLAQTSAPNVKRGTLNRLAKAAGVPLDSKIPPGDMNSVIEKISLALTTEIMGQNDADIVNSRVPGALKGLTNQPPPMTGSTRNIIGYGTDLDWPSTSDELAAIKLEGYKPGDQITEEQAEKLLQTRLGTIRTMIEDKLDGADIAPYQFRALMLAMYTSPWLKASPGSEGRPEVLTDKLIDAVYAGNWNVVTATIRRATRVTTLGLSDQQKQVLKNTIANERLSQVARMKGQP